MGSEDRIKQLELFLKEDPDDPFIIFALALEHLDTDKTKTRELFESLLIDHPDYVGTYYHAAALFAETGETEKAKATYEQGIKVAETIDDGHALRELKSAYQNFLIDLD